MNKAPLSTASDLVRADRHKTVVDRTRRGLLMAAPPLLVGAAAVPAAAASARVEPEIVYQGPSLRLAGHGPIPWIKKIHHFYTGEDGRTRAEEIPVTPPTQGDVARLLRRTAVRVTFGGAAAGAGYDFHVADYPTLLIVIMGSTIFKLHDGSSVELMPGELAIAEDCTGQGHVSYAGPQGNFGLFVQLPRELCPKVGSSDMSRFWTD